MNTLRNVFATALLSFVVLTMMQATAQPGQANKKARMEKMEAQRVAFITDRLDLTPSEAQVFWPVYNEYDAKRHELTRTYHKAPLGEEKPIEEMTEKEATEVADAQLIEAQKLLDLRKEYHARFKSVLPVKKVILLYDSERDFQKQLIDRLRNGQGKGQGKGPGQVPGKQNRAGNRNGAPN
jgi:hypothetical protein